MVYKVLVVQQELKVLKVLRDLLVYRVVLVKKDNLEVKVQLDLLDQLVKKV
jgi:hypothetical protein|tara:strand:- start:577 stop:729 length:153 start_codon:yes stop_codon:yes gene_type:complete